jgi:hypothetical protein
MVDIPHLLVWTTPRALHVRNGADSKPDTACAPVGSKFAFNGKEMTRMLDRLPIPAAAALLGAAALAVLAIAFAAGRMTAASGTQTAAALTPVRSSAASLSLPQLSQALPLPALAAEPVTTTANVTTTAAVTVQPQVSHRSRSKAGGPVDIVGSG